MLKLRTEIEPSPSAHPIGCADGVLVLGSCFADHIGHWLSSAYLDCLVNPYGVLYNPASIARNLQNTLSGRVYDAEADLGHAIVSDASAAVFYSFDHHGSLCAESAPALCDRLNALSETVRVALRKSRHWVVTFGSAYVYEKKSDQTIVANCHKFPESLFRQRLLTVDEIVALWSPLIEASPEQHILFTISPIRYLKYTLHGSQLSKATLQLAIHALCCKYPGRVEYLPVYELFMDDLRDYRFYAADLVHPSDFAIEIVKDYFAQNCLSPTCRAYMAEVQALVKALQHRPLHPESPAYRQFICQNMIKIDRLMQKYSIFTLSELKTAFEGKI